MRAAVVAFTFVLAVSAALAAPAPAHAAPSDRQCASLRAARTLAPIQAYNRSDPRAPRVFAMQFKQELRHVVTHQAFRDKIECLLREVVVPRMARGRPNVVVFNEDIGLMTIATGSRGAAARALNAQPATAPSCENQGLPCGAVAALGTIATAYAAPLTAYQARFAGRAGAISSAFLAATDTFARGWMTTFSDLAREYGVYLIGSNNQARFRESTDPLDIELFRDPDLPQRPRSVYVATGPEVYNEVFMWGPEDVRDDGPRPLRNVVASNRKVPLTPIEETFQLTAGPSTEDNLRPFHVPGTQARLGFATSLPAFRYGPADTKDPCADVSVTYMRCLDRLGTNVVIQDEANPGPWAVDGGCGGTCWQPLEWMTSTWRAAVDPDVRFDYNVTPHLVGNLTDLSFDGQTAITQRGLRDTRGCTYVGNGTFQAGDPEGLRDEAGPKQEFLAIVPWVRADGPRAELTATARALQTGSGDAARSNDYVESAIVADLPFPPDPRRGNCLTEADTERPVARLRFTRRGRMVRSARDRGSSGIATRRLRRRGRRYTYTVTDRAGNVTVARATRPRR